MPRFAYVFSGSLPLDYLHRVWDLFLYEGASFNLNNASLLSYIGNVQGSRFYSVLA